MNKGPSPETLMTMSLANLMEQAEALTLAGHGTLVTYSRKIFIPLTQLCRDVCHYCTFAQSPSKVSAPYLTLDEVESLARKGEATGCREALFTIGDQPEARYRAAKTWLDQHGYESTLAYLAAAAQHVLETTNLLPHFNPGLLSAADFKALRPFAPSMGLMLETLSDRLCEPGMPHYGSPDKQPAARLETLRLAGEARVPFTTGLLIGIGETREERIEALLAIRDMHDRYGHVQEIIIQNFRAKPGTKMQNAPEPSLDDHLWTIAVARLLFGPSMTIQAPPNLQRGALEELIRAGVNDWGGVSPVTPDHVNPEKPWPELDALETETIAARRVLRQRLTVAPPFVREMERWIDPALQSNIRQMVDAQGLVRENDWHPGQGKSPPRPRPVTHTNADPVIQNIVDMSKAGGLLNQSQIARLFKAEGRDFDHILDYANALRRERAGDTVTYVINRNINYTNICLYHCGFCAFSKGSTKSERGPAYRIDLPEIAQRALEAWERGATEVCLQGGIHPAFDGNTYLDIVKAVTEAVPGIHVHAFSPLEIHHGATTLGLDLESYLTQLKQAGLSSLPGTAAEILTERVRAIICPDKLTTAEWLGVMRAAHNVGLTSTATIMFGHVDTYEDWASHLIAIRDLQLKTGGFTEFVPLPFVHMEAPIWRKGQARPGPTWRETQLMHAVARITLNGVIDNIQASWVKLGDDGVAHLLQAGVNDLGGTLMDESITRAAGGKNGQCNDIHALRAIADGIGRPYVQRTTLYGQINEQSLELEGQT